MSQIVDMVAKRLGAVVTGTEKLGDRLAGVQLSASELSRDTSDYGSIEGLLTELSDGPKADSGLLSHYSAALLRASLARGLTGLTDDRRLRLTTAGESELQRLATNGQTPLAPT